MMKAWATTIIVLQTISAALESEALATASNAAPSSTPSNILRSSRDYHLLELAPHDTSSFTQGLTYFDGHVYEGTGLEQESHIMRHDPTRSMKTLDKVPLTPSHLFGEGICHYHTWITDDRGHRVKEHRLIQLTWKDKVGKIYSLPDLQLLKEFSYDTATGEGWGITFVPHRNELYVSDGSPTLYVWDAETLAEKRRVTVTFERRAGTSEDVRLVNELEFVDFAVNGVDSEIGDTEQCRDTGTCSEDEPSPFSPTMKILANIWYQDVLVSICPDTGKITKVFDLRDIFPHAERQKAGSDCLNGISVTGATRKEGEGLEVWVTGKLWPKMYRIQLID